MADALVLVLLRNGFDAVATYSGEQAIAAARLGEFDVLISDVMMQPMDGVEIATAFLAMHPTARIALFSGDQEAAKPLIDAALAGLAFHVFPKPLHPTELLNYLHNDAPGPGLARLITPKWTGDAH